MYKAEDDIMELDINIIVALNISTIKR